VAEESLEPAQPGGNGSGAAGRTAEEAMTGHKIVELEAAVLTDSAGFRVSC